MRALWMIPIIAAVTALPAQALPSLRGGPLTGEPGDTGTIWIGNDVDGGYIVWLEIADLEIAGFNGDPVWPWCPPEMACIMWMPWPDYGGWYEFQIVSLDPENPILAGDHMLVNINLLAEGETVLNLYDEDGATLLDSAAIIVIPQPATILLLGLGAAAMRRMSGRPGRVER